MTAALSRKNGHSEITLRCEQVKCSHTSLEVAQEAKSTELQQWGHLVLLGDLSLCAGCLGCMKGMSCKGCVYLLSRPILVSRFSIKLFVLKPRFTSLHVVLPEILEVSKFQLADNESFIFIYLKKTNIKELFDLIILYSSITNNA